MKLSDLGRASANTDSRRRALALCLAVSSLGALHAAAGDEAGSYRWLQLRTGHEGNGHFFDIEIDPQSPSTLYISRTSEDFNTGAAFKSTDAGRSWAPIEIPGVSGWILDFAVDPTNSSTVYAAVGSGLPYGVYKSTDGGETWADANGGLTLFGPNALAIDLQAPNTLYVGVSSNARAFKTNDGAETWVPVGFPEITHQVTDLAIDPDSPATVYAASWGGGVFKSTDSGGTWSPRNAGLEPYLQVAKLNLSRSNPSTIYAIGRNGDAVSPVPFGFRSLDGGDSWELILPNPFTQALVPDPHEPSTVYAGVGFPGKVLRSNDHGTTWEALGTGLEDNSVRTLAIHPETSSTIYAGTVPGLFVSQLLLFEDGFESGDTSAWTVSEP